MRLFWSYDVEKTESWLAEMAMLGNQLTHVDLQTRMFSFEKGECEKVTYQVVFDKSKSELSKRLAETGWRNVFSKGNWQFLKNEEKTITVYPVRENILKRNRLHWTIFTGLSILYGMQFLLMITLLMIILSVNGGMGQFSPTWIMMSFYLLQVVVIGCISIHATQKLRAFEQKYFSSAVEDGKVVGKSFSKWKFLWMNAPDLLEKWLVDMAAEGNHLIGVKGMRFIFSKGDPAIVSYVYDFQLKTSIHYYDIHKSNGWKLKFTSPMSIGKSSLWMKEYEKGETKPEITYDSAEQKVHVRKVLMMSVGSLLFSILMTLFMFWIYNTAYEDGWNLFAKIIMVALIISLVLPVAGMIRSLKYVTRMRRAITE